MLSFIVMIGFSLYLAGYGFIALFKQDWLMKLRAFSARVEGKGKIKHEELAEGVGNASRVVAVLALILGVVGLVMSVVMLYVFMQAQGGTIAV